MKKTLVVLLALFAVVLSATACNTSPTPEQTLPTDTSSATDETTHKPAPNDTVAPTEPMETEPAESETEATTSGSSRPTPNNSKKRMVAYKNRFDEGEPILVTAYGEGQDWIGIYSVRGTEPVRWWYLSDIEGYESVEAGKEFNMLTQTANINGEGELPAGDYIIFLVGEGQDVAKDEYIQYLEISIIGEKEVENPYPLYLVDGRFISVVFNNFMHRYNGEEMTAVWDGAMAYNYNMWASDGKRVRIPEGEHADKIIINGWTAMYGEDSNLGVFGYQINSNEPVFATEWTIRFPVYDVHAVTANAQYAALFEVCISTETMKKQNKVFILYKAPDGSCVCIDSFEVIVEGTVGKANE